MSVQPQLETTPASLPPASRGIRRFVSLGNVTFEHFPAFAHVALMIYSVAAALSIAGSQIAIIPMLVFGVVSWIRASSQERAKLLDAILGFRFGRLMAAAMLTWLGAAAIAALVGINVGRAAEDFFKAALYMLFPFCVAASLLLHSRDFGESIKRIRLYLTLLIFGQCLAALHSIASAVAGDEIKPGVPGPVTESGQLVLVLPALLALLLLSNSEVKWSTASQIIRSSGSALLFFLLMMIAWPEAGAGTTHLDPATLRLVAILGAVGIAALFAVLCLSKKLPAAVCYAPAGSLLLAALVVNLKRGPWLGVFVEMIFLSLFISRKFFLSALAFSAGAFAILAPVQNRIGSFADHFMIEGGRRSMWSIGIDLVQRFPLGLGLNNARHMREIEPSLPPLHRHMHNNVLNIAVETGWIGVAAYLWWMAIVVTFGLILWRYLRRVGSTKSEHWSTLALLALSLSSALLGWQASGLVEYNFGDGEIYFIALLYMGLLLAIGAHTSAGCPFKRP